MNRDKTDDQLIEFSKNNQLKNNVDYYCKTGYGTPTVEKNASLTVSEHGPILLQDVHYIDEIAHFDRERIPERVVHAKGAGAFGYFEVTHSEITKYCSAKIFERIGKVTPIAVRFSTVGGESGSADTVRDPRGFAVKFYTDDGIWDLVGNNTPIFFIRDPILFPSFIHTQKRNPQTHLKDPDMFWDFISLRPETTHQVMFLFSDRGIPDGYRHMNGYGSHTFKIINAHGDAFYCKFHYKTDQKIKNLTVDKADELAASDPDYGIRDLYNAIANKNYPSWTFYIQLMTFDEAKSCSFNPFDVTKVWPHREYPLIPVGKLVLNKNPENYFTDVEQIAFSPSHMVPGIEPSPDKMLQGRLFSYADTHRHRLGANYLQLKANCPVNQIWNYQRDGPQCIFNQNGTPNYYPNSFHGPEVNTKVRIQHPRFHISGDVGRFDTGDEDNFSQAGVFYRKTLNEDEKKRLINNIVNHLKNASKFIQANALRNFSKVDQTFGARLREGLTNRMHPSYTPTSAIPATPAPASVSIKSLTTKEKEKYVESCTFKYCQESSKYEIVAKIGQGTFGEVFKAKDRSNPKKFVAMKKILMDNEKEGFPITALREIRILQLLKHENVVNLIEICRTKPGQNNRYRSTLFLVFEFCEHDLAGLLSNASVKFSLGEIKKVMQQLLNGLYYIHSNKILHRDMKSANVLLTKNGVLKLADFGLARAFSNKQPNNRYTNRVVTLWYRPPELLLGERNYGPPVDLWGAGCIMAEMWTRSPIMQGSTEQQQLTLISQLCGSITTEIWPSVEQLEFFTKVDLPQNQKRKVRERLEPYMKNPYACDLLDKLLTLDPAQRYDADSALNHDFFWTDPMPLDLGHMMSQLSQSMFEYLVPPRRVGNARGHHAVGNAQRNITLQEGEYHDRVF